MNKEFNDIESYRRARRAKRRKRRIVTLSVIVLLCACLIFVFAHFLNIDLFGSESSHGGLASGTKPSQEGFPISLEGDTGSDISSMGGLLAVLTDQKFAIYSDSGKWIGSDAHGYANPVAKTTSKRALIYDRGGYKFKVVDKNNVLDSKTLTDKIVFADISDEGYVAVATQQSRYYAKLTVYDSKMQEIYAWSSASTHVVDVDFYKGSKGCAVLGYSANGGVLLSSVISLDFSSEEIKFEKKFEDLLGVSIAVKNSGNIAVVADSAIKVIDSKGNDVGEYSYSKQLSFSSNVASNYTVLALTDPNSRDNSEAVVLDDKANVVGTYVVEKRIKDVVSDGSRVLLLGEDKIYNLDMSLRLINTMDCQSDAKRIAYLGSNLYVLNADRVVKEVVE